MNLPELRWNDDGLVPAVVQDAGTREVLQLAWMNEQALRTTIEKRMVTFWSRSRKQLWTKGETSGNTLELVSIQYDCDSDALLVTARLNGVGVCHTGARTDWFRTLPVSAVTMPDNTRAPYPLTRASDHVDVLHGRGVPDPYRWLEDLDSPETAAWVAAQNELTSAFLSQVPQREQIRRRLTELWDYDKLGVPFRRGDALFMTRQEGLQNQGVLWVDDAAGERVLLDPNGLSDDGTVALTGFSPSRDARWLAYGTSEAGSDWQQWRVRDVTTGEDADDHLRWVKFSGASWTPDGAGFFYSRYDEPSGGLESVNRFQKLYYHRLGTEQAADDLVYERPDHEDWIIGGGVSEDGRFLVISVSRGTDPHNCLFYKDLEAGGDVVELLGGFEAEYDLIGNDGPVWYLSTDLGAPRRRIVAIDVTEPAKDRWREVVAETEDTLEYASLVGDLLVCVYLRDAASRVVVHRLDGTPDHEVALPGVGTVMGFSGRRTDTDTFFSFTSFSRPPTVYRHDLATRSTEVHREPSLKFDPDAFTTEQVFYESGDGTRVPMFVSRRRDVGADGTGAAFLYGYGGFNNPMTPAFSVAALRWMESGGVYAVACLRGGGEYGQAWHDAGRLGNKQNVFDDFCAAARWLVDNRWAAPGRVGIGGGSNGGLLVGACLTQHPDLFGACYAAVGVMDMLRFHKFTIGWAWTSDYGDPDDRHDFEVALAYSPLHNLRPGALYPPTIVVTGDHDDRVWPGHSFKFAATMQACQGGPAPVLCRVETRAGHGMGKPTSKQIDEGADVWAFLSHHLQG